jgi:prephenate dehydrogenase
MTITIVGIGQIGGSFALALKQNKIGEKIIGVDLEEVISNPLIKRIVDLPSSDLKESISKADFIFLATPVNTIIKLIPEIVSYMKPNAILLDSGSTKREICEKMKDFPEYMLIGGHPITGTEKSGFNASNPSLFRNRIFTLTFPTSKSMRAKDFVFNLLKKIGAIPLKIDAEEHDRILSMTSHLPYILSLTLSFLAEQQIKDNPITKKLIGNGLLSTTRLSLTHEEMGVGIIETNKEQIIKRIEEFSSKLNQIKKLIENENIKKIKEWLISTRNFQQSLRSK